MWNYMQWRMDGEKWTMNIIVFDLEWNQPTVRKKTVNGLIGEIIQIGAAKIDLSGEVLDTFQETIKPVYYLKVNKEISSLTLITDEEINNGVSFSSAIERFRQWCGETFALISWGPDDEGVLRNNLDKFELDTSWLSGTFDAQLMFDDYEMQEGRQWPLNYALYHYDEKPNGAHNALADVLSTVSVLKHFDFAGALSDDYFRCGEWADENA